MKKINALFLFVILLAACAPSAAPANTPAPPLTIFAASSLTDAFQELGKAYTQAHPDARIEFNFAGSQELRAQIEQGARADLFASADIANMDTLQQKKLIANAPRIFARNQLGIIIPASNPAKLERAEELNRAGLKIVVAADNVPAGKYTRQLIETLSHDAAFGPDFPATFNANIVSQETNVRQVLSKVALGEADAGIVYITDAASAGDKVKLLPMLRGLNVVADYPLAVLKNTAQPEQAKQFMDFVLSADGQAVLAKSGFLAAR